MFQEIEGMIQKVASGGIDGQTVRQAADQHVNAMDAGQLTQHVETAAKDAQQNGNSSVAQQLIELLETQGSNPQALKGGIVRLIEANPQILTHFAPEFVRGMLASHSSPRSQ